jgi:hypothetical protein
MQMHRLEGIAHAHLEVTECLPRERLANLWAAAQYAPISQGPFDDVVEVSVNQPFSISNFHSGPSGTVHLEARVSGDHLAEVEDNTWIVDAVKHAIQVLGTALKVCRPGCGQQALNLLGAAVNHRASHL